MSSLLLLEAARLNRMGASAFLPPFAPASQARIELSSRGFSACTVLHRARGNFHYELCSTFEESATRALTWLKKLNLRSGTSLIISSTSEQIGSDKQTVNSPAFKKLGLDSVAQIDFAARKDPVSLGLRDPQAFAYRALSATQSSTSGQGGRIDLLKLELGSTPHWTADLRGVAIHRCFGPLCWLQFLKEMEVEAFSAQTLVVLADPLKVYFVGTRQGEIIGLRILDRVRGLNIKEIRILLRILISTWEQIGGDTS